MPITLERGILEEPRLLSRFELERERSAQSRTPRFLQRVEQEDWVGAPQVKLREVREPMAELEVEPEVLGLHREQHRELEEQALASREGRAVAVCTVRRDKVRHQPVED